MKKIKLLEKDGFYLALFVCVCLVAIGGIWFTKNSVDELASKNGFLEDGKEISKVNEEDEIHLIEKEDDSVPTSTQSKENLEMAKEKEIKNYSKMNKAELIDALDKENKKGKNKPSKRWLVFLRFVRGLSYLECYT